MRICAFNRNLFVPSLRIGNMYAVRGVQQDGVLDIQVYDNMGHLFDKPDGHFYAVNCFCEKTWSHTKQYSVGYCQQCPDKVTWPAEMGSPPPLYFNARMFVFEPSAPTYENLLETLKIIPPTPFAERVKSLISQPSNKQRCLWERFGSKCSFPNGSSSFFDVKGLHEHVLPASV